MHFPFNLLSYALSLSWLPNKVYRTISTSTALLRCICPRPEAQIHAHLLKDEVGMRIRAYVASLTQMAPDRRVRDNAESPTISYRTPSIAIGQCVV